jgi:hypothetical protein
VVARGKASSTCTFPYVDQIRIRALANKWNPSPPIVENGPMSFAQNCTIRVAADVAIFNFEEGPMAKKNENATKFLGHLKKKPGKIKKYMAFSWLF